MIVALVTLIAAVQIWKASGVGKPAVVVSRDYSVHIGHNVISVEVFFGYLQTPPS